MALEREKRLLGTFSHRYDDEEICSLYSQLRKSKKKRDWGMLMELLENTTVPNEWFGKGSPKDRRQQMRQKSSEVNISLEGLKSVSDRCLYRTIVRLVNKVTRPRQEAWERLDIFYRERHSAWTWISPSPRHLDWDNIIVEQESFLTIRDSPDDYWIW